MSKRPVIPPSASQPVSLKDLAAQQAAGQSEDTIQIRVMGWWARTCAGFNVDERLLQHTPNGGKRGKREGARFKAMGVRAGWPDLFLAVPQAHWHGLFVELKKATGRLEPSQRELHPVLKAEGYAVMVAWSYEEAVTYITNYLTTGEAFVAGKGDSK